MSYHVCHQCGKHGDVSFGSDGYRHAFLATCEREDCPTTLSAKRFASMFDGKPELPPDERNEK